MAKNRKKQRIVPIHGPSAAKAEAPVPGHSSRPAQCLLPAIAIVLIIISGVLHGIQTNRWTVSTALQDAASRLQHVPATIGEWEGVDETITDEVLKQAGAAGYVSRTYKNRTTRQTVHVMILCGDHGPISLHPPTVCFTSAGWDLETVDKSEIKSAAGNRSLGEFQEAVFKRQTPVQIARMRTFWAWNVDGHWQAPDRPRFAFGGAPYLYKIYITSILPTEENPSGKKPQGQNSDACTDFARTFLPVLRQLGI